MAKDDPNYAIEANTTTSTFAAPALPYRPRDPKSYHPKIALIACGGVTAYHLTAYKNAGYNVVALCDAVIEKAQARQKEFFPNAQVYTDYREVLKRDDIPVVDIATHPSERVQIIRDAISAGKHILSQKPFVTDLAVGEELANLADRKGLKLAVNQNGRYAPHFSYIRNAISAGLLGTIFAAHLDVHWDHNWICGMEFDKVRHIILYDFAIHWFDILTCFMAGKTPKSVYATFTRAPAQRAQPNLLAQAMVEYDNAQASLIFDADTRFGQIDRTYIAGTNGTITSSGPDLGKQSVTLHTKEGTAVPPLESHWFDAGFHGTMAELLCSIEENREPANSARNNLKSLALAFAAIASAETHQPQVPGVVTKLPVP
jgi:predicted dehydrogenase